MIVGPILVIGGIVALFIVLGGTFTNITLGTVGVLAVLFVLWRLSLVFGPTKVCWRCGGDGHVGGLLGGRRDCPSCGATGRKPRMGSGR